jgi:hypothetical protein
MNPTVSKSVLNPAAFREINRRLFSAISATFVSVHEAVGHPGASVLRSAYAPN